MLTTKQLRTLQGNCQYKMGKCIFYKLIYARPIVTKFGFSVRDLKINGEPWEQAVLFSKFIVWVFKNFYIAYEIGFVRDEVIEKILDSSIGEEFDICIFIYPNMKWLEAIDEKIEFMHKITKRYLTNIKIQSIIYKIIKVNDQTDRQTFLTKLEHKIDCVFHNTIANIKRNNYLETKSDYNTYIKKYRSYITGHMNENHNNGNLFSVNYDNRKFGENK